MTPLDPMDPRPAYRQLADHLRGRINTGDLPPGALLPSQNELMAEFDTSSTTVREAVEALRVEGLVETIRGKGTFVRTPPEVRRVSSERYAHQLAAIAAGEKNYESAFTRDHGITWDQYTIDCAFRELSATPAVAQMLNLRSGAPVFERHMVMRAAGVAEQIRTAWYDLDLVAGTAMTDPARQPWPGGVIAELAELGVTITAVDEDVRGRMPTPDEARTLRAGDGIPVLDVTRVGWTGERPVEAAHFVIPADRVVLHYRLDL